MPVKKHIRHLAKNIKAKKIVISMAMSVDTKLVSCVEMSLCLAATLIVREK